MVDGGSQRLHSPKPSTVLVVLLLGFWLLLGADNNLDEPGSAKPSLFNASYETLLIRSNIGSIFSLYQTYTKEGSAQRCIEAIMFSQNYYRS